MTFDWKNPDYRPEFAKRMERMQRLRKDPDKILLLKEHYKTNPADFINDWGVTFDPRNGARGLPNTIPFLLFDKQREWIDFIMKCRTDQTDGASKKSRDWGLSWLCVGLASTLCLFNDEMVIGFGSRKEKLVDSTNDPDSLFWKARRFIEMLPFEFRGTWSGNRDTSHMHIGFPDTSSVMRGEAGDNIGRGGRSDMYFTDEDAFIPRCATVDAALSQNTNCRQRISSVNGMGNTFAKVVLSGDIPVFTAHWTDDPRKGPEWYEKQKKRLDPIILAQEVDISFTASTRGVVIPAEWANSALDAHILLGIEPTGARVGALDVADEGPDKNAYAGRHGIVLDWMEEFSGKGSDIFDTTQHAFFTARLNGHTGFRFDSDGLGVGVRGDARILNLNAAVEGVPELDVKPFRGSGEIVEPENPIPTPDGDYDTLDRLNKDFFGNAKAQAWWHLRVLFQRTHRAVEAVKRGEANPYDVDSLISISSNIPDVAGLIAELSQPTWGGNGAGKMIVNKTPDGMKSPNRADAVMILYAPSDEPFSIFEALK